MDTIYLDNNATTRPAAQVVQAMLTCLTEHYGNPSSVHRVGQRARQAIEEARAQVAQVLGAGPGRITFSGGGTESINTAIRGALAARAPRRKIVTSTVEHAAIRAVCEALARDGVEVVSVGVDRHGQLDLDAFTAAVDEHTALASLIWANNETGVIFPVEQALAACRARGVPLHVDATQCIGKLPVDVGALPVDLLCCAAHKFHGPKGVGILYARRGLRIPPLVLGGPQEFERRGGTENVAAIVGAGVAADLARVRLSLMPAVARLRDHLEQGLLARCGPASVNGAGAPRVGNTCNISFHRLAAEAILVALSEKGICASAGSACSSGSLEPSPVIRAMMVPEPEALGAVRFSLSSYTTEAEIEQALEVIPPVIERLRQVLPAVVSLGVSARSAK